MAGRPASHRAGTDRVAGQYPERLDHSLTSRRTAPMRAMVLDAGARLTERNLPQPEPGPHQVLVRVIACGVCRTDLHIRDGELNPPRLPLVLGHEVVGTVEAVGAETSRFSPGTRVGIPWLGSTCGVCEFCRRGEEN